VNRYSMQQHLVHLCLTAALLLAASPGTAGLVQIAEGTTFGQVESLYSYNGSLYVGTRPSSASADSQLFRSDDGSTLTDITDPGMGMGNPRSLTSFDGGSGEDLYVLGLSNSNDSAVWRSSDGSSFSTIVSNGFGDAFNTDTPAYAEFNGELFVGTRNDGGGGGEIWRSSDGTSWTQSGADGLGDSNNARIGSLVEFDGMLYATTQTVSGGAEIHRSSDGLSWEMVVGDGNSYGGTNSTDGFGYGSNFSLFASVVYEDHLYVGVRKKVSSGKDAELWRTLDGINWEAVMRDGFGDSANSGIMDMIVYNGQLIVGTINNAEGAELWSSVDGSNFNLLADDGFGNATDNVQVRSLAVHAGRLYVGTGNDQHGTISAGELHLMVPVAPVWALLVPGMLSMRLGKKRLAKDAETQRKSSWPETSWQNRTIVAERSDAGRLSPYLCVSV